MAEEIQGTGVIEVASAPGAHGAEPSGEFTDFSWKMVTMTWITFIITAIILYKMAWKPILRALEAREQRIRKSLEDAETARRAAAESEQRCRQMIADAEKQARETLDAGRAAASQMAQTIENRARQDAERAVQDARKEIEAATARARETLRRDTAELAVSIAGRLVRENMDTPRNQALSSKLAEKL